MGSKEWRTWAQFSKHSDNVQGRNSIFGTLNPCETWPGKCRSLTCLLQELGRHGGSTWHSSTVICTEILSQYCLSVSCVSVCLAWTPFSVERGQWAKHVASGMRASKPGGIEEASMSTGCWGSCSTVYLTKLKRSKSSQNSTAASVLTELKLLVKFWKSVNTVQEPIWRSYSHLHTYKGRLLFVFSI